jgi:hypothetical protein
VSEPEWSLPMNRTELIAHAEALAAELAECKSDLAAVERAENAAHDACLDYEARVKALEAALWRFIEWEAADLTDAERAYGLVRVVEQARHSLTAPETISKQPDEYAAHSPECYLRKFREGFCDCELPQSDRASKPLSEWIPMDLDHPAPANVPVLIAYGFKKADRVAVATWERVGPSIGWHLGGNSFAMRPRYWMLIPAFPMSEGEKHGN